MDASLGVANAEGTEYRPHRTYQYTPASPPSPDSNPASSGAGSPQTHEQLLENKKRFRERWWAETEYRQQGSRGRPEEERERGAVDMDGRRYETEGMNTREKMEDDTRENTATKRRTSPPTSTTAKRPRTNPQSPPCPETNETDIRPLSPLFLEPRGMKLKPNMMKMIQLIKTAQGELARRGVEVTVDRYATTWIAREAEAGMQGWELEDIPDAEMNGLEEELKKTMQLEDAEGVAQAKGPPKQTKKQPPTTQREQTPGAGEGARSKEHPGDKQRQEDTAKESRGPAGENRRTSKLDAAGKKREREDTGEQEATTIRPTAADGGTTNGGDDRQNPTETRAEYLTRKGALNVTPPPPEGYPEVHARDPYDHLRYIPRDKLHRFLQRPEDTTCMVDIFGAPPNSPAQARELESNLRAALTTITGGKRIQITHPEVATTTAWHEEGSSTVYMVHRLPPGTPTILRTQRMWDTTLASFRALDEKPSPPRFLYALSGVVADVAETIREELAKSLVSGKASVATKIALRGDALAPYNLEDGPQLIAKSLRVELATIKPPRYAGAEQKFALVYCDPPTSNNELWMRWRDDMAKIRLESATGPARADFRCGGCHGADHTTSTCPYDRGRYPGWKGMNTSTEA